MASKKAESVLEYFDADADIDLESPQPKLNLNPKSSAAGLTDPRSSAAGLTDPRSSGAGLLKSRHNLLNATSGTSTGLALSGESSPTLLDPVREEEIKEIKVEQIDPCQSALLEVQSTASEENLNVRAAIVHMVGDLV